VTGAGMHGEPSPPGFLAEMVAGSRRRVASARAGGHLVRPTQTREPGRLREALARPSRAPGNPSPQLAVIAEVKRRSPSKGDIAPGLDAAAQARAYRAAGADAVSVLTEPSRFGGSLDDLRTVAAAVDLPVLRKDFIVDRGQVWEAAAAGAAAVLLIVAILSDDRLHDLLIECLDCGLDPLVEVHDLEEARRACRAGCTLVGINNRDLVTLEVDLATTEYLAPALGPCMFPVSESGISTPADACRAALSGARALLVGETLLRTPPEDLPALIASLKDPGWPE
jgi:indole-3-glycerol phosphate synthase